MSSATTAPASAAKTSSAIFQLNQGTTAKTISQRCFELIRKLACLEPIKADFVDPLLKYYAEQKPPVMLAHDPVTIAWNLCRQGAALCALINKFRANTIARIVPWDTPITEASFKGAAAKNNLFACLEACKNELYMTDDQLFLSSNLLGEDTNTLSKAIDLANNFLERIKKTQAINFTKRVDALVASDPLYADIQHVADGEKPKRLLVFEEFYNTERTYVNDLEKLAKYKEELRMDNVVSEELLKDLFSNLDKLMDFQRSFFIAFERQILAGTRSLQASYDSHIGNFFIEWEKAFGVYDEYCANFNRAKEVAAAEVNALKAKAAIIDPMVLESFLIKPVQRVCKYPLLFREIIKNSPKDSPDLKELEEAERVAKGVGDRVNEKQRKAENAIIAEDFKSRVDDWKGIEPSRLGDLEMFGKMTASIGAVEKEVQGYLFPSVLIMCREGKGLLASRQKKLPLQIRGQFELSTIQRVEYASPQSFTMNIPGSDGSGRMESITFKFPNEELTKKWATCLKKLGKIEVVPLGAAIAAKPEIISLKDKRTSRAFLVDQRGLTAGVVAPNEGRPVPIVAPAVNAPPPVVVEKNLRLKVAYHNEVYLILVPDLENLEEVKEKALKKVAAEYALFGKDPGIKLEDVRLKYKDEFGDIITMSTDDDLKAAMQYNPNVLKVIVTSKSEFQP